MIARIASDRTPDTPAAHDQESIMPDIIKDTRYLRTKEAAHYVGLSARTLEKHRTYGTGPAYRKIGGRVVYTLEELRAWADRGACASTSDPNNGTVPPAVRRPGEHAPERS
jgi:predicted DNA-binding transcriptional regulator AlpA